MASAADAAIELPQVALGGIPFEATVTGAAPGDPLVLEADGLRFAARADADGVAILSGLLVERIGGVPVTLYRSTPGGDEAVADATLRVIPGWFSVLPPLIAILVALTLRNVIPALMLGIWLGATALISFSPSGAFRGLLDAFQVYVSRALADADHVTVILFSFMIGGMVGIVTRNGGMFGIVNVILRFARNAVSGQISVWLMGLAIFFDDYGNTLVVGNTSRSVTDILRISREKLAYIVDSTAAPVSCIALVTTWIGYEVGLIGEAVKAIPDFDQPAYSIFVNSIPYSFYPILAILFVFIIAYSGRDFGPMYRAEVRARGGQVRSVLSSAMSEKAADELEPKEGIPIRAVNGLLPIAVLIVALIGGLLVTGEGETVRDIVGSADSYKALMWASLLSVITATALTLGQRIMTVAETVEAWYSGVRSMLFAMIILVLAWALSEITTELHTAAYLVGILGDALQPALVPAIVFVISALTAFSTGTSWGTMGILMPLVIPLTWAVMAANGMDSPQHFAILYSAISCNLAGAVWGDHCSPISDTTVLSSMASGCDHIEHVRTQLPYAVCVGVVALLVGTIPAGYGLPWWLCLGLGAGLLVVLVRFVGRPVEASAGAPERGLVAGNE